VCSSVCPRATSRNCIETTGPISGFGMDVSFDLSYTVIKKKLIHVCAEINVVSSGTLSQTLDFTTFATARRSSQRVVNLTRQWRTIVVINWTVVVQVNNACDDRQLVDRPPLSTARFHRAGPSATAVERGLVVGFCGQPHYCYRPYYPTAGFPSPSSYVVSDEPFPGRSRPM